MKLFLSRFFKLNFGLFLLFSFTYCYKENDLNNNSSDFRDNLNDSTIIVKPKLKYLALGDSYTIGQGVQLDDNFPNQLSSKLTNEGIELDELKIIATTGWSTDDLLQNLYRDNIETNYNLVSILIGVNNQFRKMDTTLYKTQLVEIIDLAKKYAGDNVKNIFALSIPDYWYTPFGQNYPQKTTEEIAWYNATKKRILTENNIKFYNITPITQKGLEQPELVAKDNLHPSALMYSLWIDEFYKDVLQILSK